MKLLSVSADAKTVKGEKKGYLTGILYLAPADESGVMNTCANSSPGCRAACLYTAGRAEVFPRINEARKSRTYFLHYYREEFLEMLRKDIDATIRKAKREGMIPVFRLNGTSDLPWLGRMFAAEFPKVQFYDYTKHPRPWERTLPNYHLTFSLSENNYVEAIKCLAHGINVAVVFDTKRGRPLPKEWHGYKVVDGDETDLRFKNGKRSNSASSPSNAGLTAYTNKSASSAPYWEMPKLKGVIIGLRAKGRAKQDCTGFVQRKCGDLVQIGGKL